MKARFRPVLPASLAVILICSGCATLRGAPKLKNAYEPGAPLHAEVESETIEGDCRRTVFRFEGVRGEEVPALLLVPKVQSGPVPCVVFVHGISQDKLFAEEIFAPFAENGFALASFDQYTRGERGPKELSVGKLLALRDRAVLNVVETRRLIDCLETRQDIKGEAIYLVGASFGAISGCTSTALDKRIQGAVLAFGGGDLGLLARGKGASRVFGVWRYLLTPAFLLWFGPLDPIRYVDQISPRPLLFQNGLRDEVVPPESARALYEAAEEPKEIIWYDWGHVGEDRRQVERIVRDAVDWLTRQERRRQRAAGANGRAGG